MRISRDVTFDESRPYYPRSPSGSSGTAESLSFLTLPEWYLPLSSPSSSPPQVSFTPPPPPPPPPTSPPSPPPPTSPPLVSPPPSSLHPSREITHYYTRRPRPAPPLDSSPSVLGPHPKFPPRYSLHDHSTLRPPDRLGFIAAVLAEPETYQEATVHQEWQHAMAEEIAALERIGT